MSLQTMLLAVLAIAIWSAAIATRWQSREIRSQLQRLPLQNLYDQTLVYREYPQEPDRLALATRLSRPVAEVDEQGVRGSADLLRRDDFRIRVPEDRPCELRAFLVETDPGDSDYHPTPIPNADRSVPLSPGIHRLRWDARIDLSGKIIHYGVLLDDQWAIRGEQPRDWLVRPPARSTVTNPAKQIGEFEQFGGTEMVHYGAYAHFFPLAPGSNKPTTELHIRVYEVDRATEQVQSE
jgi:hypothetical protein